GGDDRLTLDYTSGTPLATAGMTYIGGTQSTATADRLIITGSISADILSLNNTTLSFNDTINYSSLESITINAGSGIDTLNYNGPVSTATVFNAGTTIGPDTLNINGGVFSFDADAVTGSSQLKVNVNVGAALFNTSQH